MEDANKGKITRVLDLYTKLIQGEVINKAEEARQYNVNERSIQRDIEDIRNYLDMQVEDTGIVNTVVYDRKLNGYRLEQEKGMKLSNSEALAICKMLLDSRAFTKNEMQQMLSRIIKCCVPESNHKQVYDLIRNEEYHYIEPQHKTTT